MNETMELLRGALQDSYISLGEQELRNLARAVDRQQSDEPPTITVYTGILQALAEWSARVDEGDITENDFVDLQQIRPRIIQGHNERRYETDEYHALMTTYNHIADEARAILRG